LVSKPKKASTCKVLPSLWHKPCIPQQIQQWEVIEILHKKWLYDPNENIIGHCRNEEAPWIMSSCGCCLSDTYMVSISKHLCLMFPIHLALLLLAISDHYGCKINLTSTLAQNWKWKLGRYFTRSNMQEIEM
jgi:hypothetical protein